MSNGKPCERHNFPRDICARCKGALEERVRIIALAKSKLCFDHIETGNCEHSVCFGMREVITTLKESE